MKQTDPRSKSLAWLRSWLAPGVWPLLLKAAFYFALSAWAFYEGFRKAGWLE